MRLSLKLLAKWMTENKWKWSDRDMEFRFMLGFFVAEMIVVAAVVVVLALLVFYVRGRLGI